MPLCLFLMATATLGRPADLSGAWELIAEWTDAPSNVQPGGQRDDAIEALLEPQDDVVIMQRESAVMIVDDDGHSQQYSTRGVMEHRCSTRGCVPARTRWERQTLRQTFTLGDGLTLDETYSRPARNRLEITMAVGGGRDRRVVSRRMYALIE